MSLLLRVGAIAASTILAACGGAKEPPAPGCRDAVDCEAAGMHGATCVEERCQYIGKASGAVRVPGAAPAGTLHVVAYPRSAFNGENGPTSGVAPLSPPVSIQVPAYPQHFELTGLPDGRWMLYAFVDVDGNTASETRACVGDVVGLRAFTVASGVAKTDDELASTDVDTYLSLDVAFDNLCQ